MALSQIKILLATDFTEASQNAVDYAIRLFSNWTDAEVKYLLVHAFKPLVPYSNTPAIPVIENETLERELERRLDKTAAELKEKFDVKPIFERGAVNEVIFKIIEKEKPHLIVMGSREKSAMERMTFGTNTVEVATTVKCPVLAIPKEARFGKLQNIVLTTDFEPLEISFESLSLLKEIVSEKSRLIVLHVFPSGDAEELKQEMINTALHRYLSDTDHQHLPVINSNIYEGITSFVEENKPALVAVIPRDRNFFEKIFHTGITEKMVYHTQIPVLILV